MTAETSVYRAFDDCGQLLYVGITDDIGRRFGQHAQQSSPWFRHCSTLKIQHCPSRADASDEESSAIRDEDPVFNVSGRPTERSLKWTIAYPAGRRADEVSDDELSGVLSAALLCLRPTSGGPDAAA